MSGIYGSNDKKKFLKLQQHNIGSEATDNSMLFLSKDGYDIYKLHHKSKDFKFPRKKYNTYIGVCENKTNKFEPDYLNPVVYDNWIVASCGDITNVNEIIELDDKDIPNSVAQSHSIVSLLNYIYSKEHGIDSALISEAISLAEGKFAIWIHNCDNGNVFLAKRDYELYADVYDNTFSSKPFDGLDPLNDNELYQLTREGITHVSFFESY